MVTFILVMVLVSGRFIKYLAEAAAGEIAADALFLVMAFRMPEFLQMIVPLSLYIGLLLVLGACTWITRWWCCRRAGRAMDGLFVR